jgi:exodeoxyribonuclease V alpha subunit
MQENAELKGTIDRFLFQNNENGYSVLSLHIDEQTIITATGYLPNLQAGQEVILRGTWITHPKFGRQFEAKECVAQIPTSIVGLKKYLGSGLIKGIGPVYAEKLVGYFGEIVLEVIDKTPHRLHEVPGIGPKRIEQIAKAWQDQKEISNVMVYLQDKGISTAYAAKIYKAYGQNSIAVLTENPYRLADEIWGVGFKMADQIAQAIGIPHDSLKRVKAGILFAISTSVGQGHLYAELQELKKNTAELLELAQESIESLLKNAFHDLYNEEKIKLISTNNLHYVTLTHYYFAEKGTAQKLVQLLQYPSQHNFNINEIYQSLRLSNPQDHIELNEDQQQGILACVQHKVSIITGGPGTGKTTLIKKLLSILDEHKLSYKLAAPTGRAAKRITENTGKFALTIHRLLEFDAATRGFSRNEQNALQLDFLIIDEASMIDIFLAYAILKAMPFDGRLILIGDVDQLPSVGAGNFLNDLIASKKIPTTRLKEIFRQAQDSLIIVNAHRVNQGELPISSLPGSKKDFVFIKENDPTMVNQHLDELLLKRIGRSGISRADTMVLVPMNRGIVGTQQINMHLQKVLNPLTNDTKQITHGMYRYQVGDRVMQIRNNYDKAVFNGDTGTIDDINISDKIILVKFYDRIVEYELSDLDELVLAYAISIHKSQGSEYAAVIIPIFMQHFTLLQRNLIYTALTRAKKLCIIIGQPKALAMAIKNNKSLTRITFLTQFLTTDLQCR